MGIFLPGFSKRLSRRKAFLQLGLNGKPTQRHVAISALGVSSFFLLMTFQNCGLAKHESANQKGQHVVSHGSLGSSAASAEGSAEISATQAVAFGDMELIADPAGERGFQVVPPSGGSRYTLPSPFSSSSSANSPIWMLAQWQSRSSIPSNGAWATDGSYQWANSDKEFKAYKGGMYQLGVNASTESSGFYSGKNIHLLLQQNIGNPEGHLQQMSSLAETSALSLNIEVRKVRDSRNVTNGYDPNRHAAIFPMHFTIQDLNPASPGYGRYAYLGLNLYDDREAIPKDYIGVDGSTGMLIYAIPYTAMAQQSPHSGDWVHFSGNILPYAVAAVREGVKRGVLVSDRLSDYKIGMMSIGFEINGLNDAAIQFRNLSLRLSHRAPEGLFMVGGGVFYSNGGDAVCGYSSWEHFIRASGRKDLAGVLQLQELPKGQRFDGPCKDPGLAEGLFKIQSAVHYSNGKGHYCSYESPDHFRISTRGASPQSIRVESSIPSSMTHDGLCEISVVPEGLFLVTGGVFYSNGDRAYCGFSSWEHFLSRSGRANLDGVPVLPSLPRLQNYDGACQ